MTDLPKPCIVCGQPCQTGRCPEHPAKTPPRPSRAIGYDTAWDRLSRRARTLQPFCTDCGTTHNLTADHLPTAWERKEQGLSLRLQDVEVVCAPCNKKRGSSRPGTPRGERASQHAAGDTPVGSETITHPRGVS